MEVRSHRHGLESLAGQGEAGDRRRCQTGRDSPEDLAEHSDTVITMLTDADAIDHVYNGEHGLLAGDARDKLFIEMSTVLTGSAGFTRESRARVRRALRRVSGRRHDRSGAAVPSRVGVRAAAEALARPYKIATGFR